jgi:YD repeat-containing protein
LSRTIAVGSGRCCVFAEPPRTQYVYDGGDRGGTGDLLAVVSDGGMVMYRYDGAGRLVGTDTSDTSVAYEYDVQSRLTKASPAVRRGRPVR